jgi:hypothetical protein
VLPKPRRGRQKYAKQNSDLPTEVMTQLGQIADYCMKIETHLKQTERGEIKANAKHQHTHNKLLHYKNGQS